MSAHHGSPSGVEQFDVDDPRNTRFDLVHEGLRRDGMEIAHYEPAFPPGKKGRLEKRIERSIALTKKALKLDADLKIGDVYLKLDR